jgi:hypothetical protein
MRAALMLVPVVVTSALWPAAVAAQLPRDLGDVVRKMPSLDRFLRGRPLESTFDDTLGPQRFLDRRESGRQPGDLTRLPRTSTGGFVLRPGLWQGTFDSFCLRTATWAPGAGDGYLWAPIKGSRAGAVSAILRGAAAHPAIPRGDVQMLLWAILSRTRVDEMPPRLQVAARALLPASEINAINVNGLQVLDVADRTRLFRGLTAPVRQALEVESDLRYQFSRANANYEEIERIAVLGGTPPPANRNAVTRGQWSRHPSGYYVRYYPDSFARMDLQVLVPARVRVARDRLNRIISIEDSRGGKTETTYNDAVAPRPHPRHPRLKAYAFKTIRITRRPTGGPPEVFELKDTGYTFHQSQPPRRRGVIARAFAAARDALAALTGAPLEARQDWDGWVERIEQAWERWEDYEWLRDRAEATTTTGDDSAVDDLGDTEHYEDGIDAALSGDASDRYGWLAEHQERQNEALEHAVWVLDTLPTTSTTDDAPAWDPGGGVGMPSGGGQTLGVSGR